jgi:hypothetical protein
MDRRLSVDVLDGDGNPVAGTRVTLDIHGIWQDGVLEACTDDAGRAAFKTSAYCGNDRAVTIYVRGERFGPYRIGEERYTVQLSREPRGSGAGVAALEIPRGGR